MIKVIYNKVCGRCVQSEPLTSGMVGQPIELEYSPDFDGLTLTAVFTNGKTTIDVPNPSNQCVIPHEVLDTVGTLVKVGVYAVRGNELVIPTVYATIGVVQKGADPSGDVSADPTLPVWSQIQGMIGNLNDLNTEAKNNLVAAVNEVKQSGGGGGSTVELDTTLTQSGKAADAKAVGDRLSALSEEIANLQTSGLTTAQVNALDGMFKVCAFTKDDVSSEYTAFKTAFGITDEPVTPEVTLSSISATYSGGSVPVGTAVSALTGIVVTAHYSDGTSKAVTGYTLDGTIAEGENTISVTYNGKTATFTVTGTVEHERVEHIVSGQTFPITLTWTPVPFDVTPALAHYETDVTPVTYYDVEIDVESISSENAYITVAAGGGPLVRNASDYAGQTGTLKMTGEIWHPSMSDASQIKLSCNKGTETSNQTAVITGVRIYER